MKTTVDITEANFKEVQLRKLRIGQPVTLSADLYGQQVSYRGRIAGLGVGTGAAFALLPAQNATGNWIKIVQRVPVRIELTPEQVAAKPLRVGLSLVVNVDTHDSTGQPLGSASAEAHLSHTSVFDGQREAAEQRIAEIIAANRGKVSAIPARP
jgi:membrane fusion protein (multidrug efflux system)